MSVVPKAQITFVKTLGGVGNDIANSAIETQDGNYLIVGSTTSFGSGGSDAYVSKVNGSAKEIWDKAIGGNGNDIFLNGIQLKNGDFILVGGTFSFGNGGEDLMVVKVSNFGEIKWTKTFGGSNDERGHAALETSDGDIIVAGHTKSFGTGNLDVFIIKLTSDGNEVWSKSYGTTGNDWFDGEGLIEDSDGNYVITGSLWKPGSGSTPQDGMFLKLDTDGNIILLRGYGDDNNDGFNGNIREYGNGFRNIGISWSWNGSNHEIWMSDLTFDGEINWSKTIGLPGENIRIGSSQFTEDGNYLISGHEFTEPTNAKGRAILLKVSTAGEIIWAKSYGDIGFETLDVVFETANGIIAFGKTTSFGEGENDIFVVRADNFGTVSGCSESLNLTTTDVIPISENLNFQIEDLSLGVSQLMSVSNIDNVETVVCDGCNSTDLVAGLFCESAPIICSIDCLDGFSGTLPNDLLIPQPDPLCTDEGGIANNVSWFAFVAGSNTIDLSIIPSNCTTIYNDAGTMPHTIGIQAGIYEDCSFKNSIVCQTDGCFDLVAETVNLASDQFVEGQVYYLFVDGCGGSVCDYEVVVNSAQQAFEIDEITTISNNFDINLEEDTLCLGTEIIFTIDDFDQNVNFNWSIDPATSDYPSGVHPVTDTSAVAFQFSNEGCFDIHVYAYNECDISETQTFSVCVQPLEDEIFSDIYVCQECFPITLVAPESGCIITEGGSPTILIEDPNGDGVPGWLGTSTIIGPGLSSNLVTNNFGCTYMQYVNIVERPLPPREQVDYYYCLGDFPVDINGTIFNNPGDTRNIIIEGGADSGCDSLMSITAHVIDFFGSPSVGSCEAGEVELAIIINDVPPDNLDSITYVWYDENGDIILDNDGVDSILVVMNVGSYSVQVDVIVDGVSCPQTFGPYMVDVDNLAPATPNVTYAPIDICVSELQAQIYVANQSLGENYIWAFVPSMPFSFGLTSDTVYVDISNGQDFEFCVHAVNGCGSTIDICDDVVVIESPDSEFSIDSEICLDDLATIEYTGASSISSGSVFDWDFDGGIIMNGMNPNSGGPFKIEFPNADQYTVSLLLSESGCNSIITEYMIEVIQPFSPPIIECESDIGSVTFTWDNTSVEDVNIIILTEQTSFELTENSYTVTGLNSEEIVDIQMIFNQDHICGASIIPENCTSLPCPDIELAVSLSDQDICIENGQDIILDVTIIGNDSGIGNWESQHLYNNNLFDIEEAGVGEHLISYSYQLGDCIFTRDTLIAIYSSPELDTDISLSFCEEMGSNLIDIITSSNNAVLLDDEVVSNLEGVEVEIGDHNLNVTSPEGCSSSLDFTIESFGVEDLAISGEPNIIKGGSEDYTALFTSNLDDLILIWTLDADTICVNCNDVTINPVENSELCVAIEYGNGCTISDCMLIEINEKTQLFIPNAFSPNNDNINDHFAVNSNNSFVFVEEIMIFDRWGEMVYNKTGFNLSEESFYWDGTKNGNSCAEGVYVYIISYVDEESQKKKITGDLTLVR